MKCEINSLYGLSKLCRLLHPYFQIEYALTVEHVLQWKQKRGKVDHEMRNMPEKKREAGLQFDRFSGVQLVLWSEPEAGELQRV